LFLFLFSPLLFATFAGSSSGYNFSKNGTLEAYVLVADAEVHSAAMSSSSSRATGERFLA
jgi:hypothetical protein